jgi:hypothetical protein
MATTTRRCFPQSLSRKRAKKSVGIDVRSDIGPAYSGKTPHGICTESRFLPGLARYLDPLYMYCISSQPQHMQRPDLQGQGPWGFLELNRTSLILPSALVPLNTASSAGHQAAFRRLSPHHNSGPGFGQLSFIFSRLREPSPDYVLVGCRDSLQSRLQWVCVPHGPSHPTPYAYPCSDVAIEGPFVY